MKILDLLNKNYSYEKLAMLIKDEISADNVIITISATYNFHTTEYTTPKTKASERQISVSDNLINLSTSYYHTDTNVIFVNSQRKTYPS